MTLTVHFHLHDRLTDAEMDSILSNLTAHIWEERKAQIPGFDKLMGSWDAEQTSDSEEKSTAPADGEPTAEVAP